jgi:hypothetical protein
MSEIQSFQAAPTTYTKQQDCDISTHNKEVSVKVLISWLHAGICFGET